MFWPTRDRPLETDFQRWLYICLWKWMISRDDQTEAVVTVTENWFRSSVSDTQWAYVLENTLSFGYRPFMWRRKHLWVWCICIKKSYLTHDMDRLQRLSFVSYQTQQRWAGHVRQYMSIVNLLISLPPWILFIISLSIYKEKWSHFIYGKELHVQSICTIPLQLCDFNLLISNHQTKSW